MPTVCGDGMSDVWPLSWLEPDLNAHLLVDSPLTITLSENGEGDFTAHIEAQSDVTGARFCMVAMHDDFVPAYGGATSHLPYHVVHMMTATTGDPFSLSAGASTDINHTFTVQPEWDYGKMSVACWVQAPGGTNTSPNPYGDVPIKNHVLQSAFIEAGSTGVEDGETTLAALALAPPSPNPFRSDSRLSFTTLKPGRVTVAVYDVSGRMVAELARGDFPEGEHDVSWDGLDEKGEQCGSGVFFVRAVLDGREQALQKLVRIR